MKNLITEYKDWERVYRFLIQQRSIAVDLEANGLHTYPEHICLLQFSAANKQFIVYPEALGNADELRALLKNENVEKVFHSCDYDIRSLHRDYNAVVCNMFDTAVGAQFLGSPQLGLANVLNRFLGLEIEKNKKLQKMDWGQRPLPEEALIYAADDVAHLIQLKHLLNKKLIHLKRLSWVQEENKRLENLQHKKPESAELSYLNIKGIRTLKSKQVAVMRELCIFREKAALKYKRPPFKIVSNATLIEMARHPKARIDSVKGIGKWLLRKEGDKLKAALLRGHNAKPIKLPPLPPRPARNNGSAKKLVLLKEWRKKKGVELSLDPAILWPLSSLQKLLQLPDHHDRKNLEMCYTEVRQWQKEKFKKELTDLIKSLE